MRRAEHVARRGSGELCTGFWWGILRERDHLEGPGLCVDNIKVDLLEVGYGDVDWIDLAQERER